MPFQSRVFTFAKDAEHPEQFQDAYALDPQRGIAVVADGVASAIFSRQWAAILTEATLADPPDPNHPQSFADWLRRQRQAWSQQIDTGGLAWFQKAKLPLGAFSTLLWIRLVPPAEQQPGTFGAYRLQSFAIGDSCLFHVRHGQLLRTFPIQQAAELEADPLVLGSVDLNRDGLMRFAALDELCYPDDLLVLCTDAIAQWALRLRESGEWPAWDKYWALTRQEWEDEIVRLRQQQQMRYDDATLVLLRVTGEGVGIGEPERPASGTAAAEQIGPAARQAPRSWKKWKEKAVAKYREKFGHREGPARGANG
jgi:serine/threonine protein phosphatase PrpC